MLQLRRRMDSFRKKSPFIKKPYFLAKKTLLFVIKDYECINEYLKIRLKNMADIGIRSRHLWFPNRIAAHTYVSFKHSRH